MGSEGILKNAIFSLLLSYILNTSTDLTSEDKLSKDADTPETNSAVDEIGSDYSSSGCQTDKWVRRLL